ncbi:unnamed protein product [Durusdinium trenchii]|uniref:Dynein regulatory complex protein 9 n=1 Tax=Durusdinium trenchii TaxID=1381693 RepID=A0ABP0LRU8_9DINO
MVLIEEAEQLDERDAGEADAAAAPEHYEHDAPVEELEGVEGEESVGDDADAADEQSDDRPEAESSLPELEKQDESEEKSPVFGSGLDLLSGSEGAELQEAEAPKEAKAHSDMLREALEYLAQAQRSLCNLGAEVSAESLERLYAAKRLLREDLEIASTCTVDGRLQALLKQHSEALEESRCAEEKCQAEKPELLMLQRSIAEIHRRMHSPKPSKSAREDVDGTSPRSTRLQALEEAVEKRSTHAEVAKEKLLSEDALLSANLNVAKNVLKEAVLEGQRLEEMRDEAAAEVFRACRALAQLSHLELLGKQQPKRYQKVKELDNFLATSAAAPWRLSALHQPPQTGSVGTTSATAALLDPEAYRLNRDSATAQADKDLETTLELYASTREELKRAIQDEVQRQKEEEQTFAAELQSLKERLQQRRHGVDTALASRIAEKDRQLQEAHRQLTVELRQIETQERSNQDALRQEVIKARKRWEQASAAAKQRLDLHLARVKADCREMLRGTAIQWEKAVLQERKALKEAKERREKWQKRVDYSRNAFRGHCVKTGVYARSMDASRRAILDSIVPRAKVGDLTS